MDKNQLRRDILGRRDALSPSRQKEHGERVLHRLLSMEDFQRASTLFIYVSFRSELETMPIIKGLIQAGKRVVVPVTLVAEKDLLPVFITDPEEELCPGYCSIPEPRQAIWKKNAVPAVEIDMVLLPGSVFDERGGRMGYGGGYYDRFVSAKAPQALRVGLCHDLQMVPEAPLQEHDEMLDYIVTEERCITGIRKSDGSDHAQDSNL
jgi:5-formyltetrahydrofolate cyclo-ligase